MLRHREGMSDTTSFPVDRLGLEVLPPEVCWDLIEQAEVGRIAFVDAGDPVVFPVTHALTGHRIVFRTGVGTKLEAARMARVLAFEVDYWEPAERRGWSVLVRGRGELVDDDEAERCDELGLEPWVTSAANGSWVAINADEITGRRIPSEMSASSRFGSIAS